MALIFCGNHVKSSNYKAENFEKLMVQTWNFAQNSPNSPNPNRKTPQYEF
jgi:hypothetical protein